MSNNVQRQRSIIDMVGRVCGGWEVLELAPKERGSASWVCRHVCGAIHVMLGIRLRSEPPKYCNKCRPKMYVTAINGVANVGWQQRFFARLKLSDGCWEWAGGRNDSGYGTMQLDGATIAAHRVAWLIFVGSIPDGIYVLHKCDNRPCCNPSHLFLGTHADNMADMYAKGRNQPRAGEENGRARLTEDDVIDIRTVYALGGSARDIGRAYGVTQATIRFAVVGATWPNAGGHISNFVPRVKGRRSRAYRMAALDGADRKAG